MTTQTVPLIDRLKERGFVDRWAFLLFASIGILLILLLKWLELSAVVTATAGAFTLLLYAFIVDRSGTGRLRADQAGDNCYYLGLIFTLASLAYAIFTFDPANTATTIVQGFGIALATTIVGLVLRVFFSQSRVDLVETEDSARLELADAAGRLKAELSQIVVSLNDFSIQTRQSLDEARTAGAAGLASALESAVESIGTMSAAAESGARSHTEGAIASAKALTSATARVTAALERHAGSVETLGASNERFASGLVTLEELLRSVQQGLEQWVRIGDQVRSGQVALDTAHAQLDERLHVLGQNVDALSGAVGHARSDIEARTLAAQAIPQVAVERSVEAIDQATAALLSQFQSLGDAHRRTVENLSEQGARAAEEVRQHNDALERELARSRQNVEKVHSALVEMTAELREQVASLAEQ